MRLADLDESTRRQMLAGEGICLSAPPFVFRLKSPLPFLEKSIALAYADFSLADERALVDFELTLSRVSGLRRWLNPLGNLAIDGSKPFDALPLAQAFPLLEWGMNWCVTANSHHLIMCHSAVLAWHDMAVMLPAPPGSGKSTLCAALAQSGWRLLSDELALIDPASLMLQPFVRPVSLKNASIELIGRRYPQAIFTPAVSDTIKGTVAHMQPPRESVIQAKQLARPRWLIFPRYEAGVELALTTMLKAEALTELIRNSFNFSGLGVKGFSSLAAVVDSIDCYRLHYSSLDQAIAAFSRLSEKTERPSDEFSHV